jgi:hypothetical protein
MTPVFAMGSCAFLFGFKDRCISLQEAAVMHVFAMDLCVALLFGFKDTCIFLPLLRLSFCRQQEVVESSQLLCLLCCRSKVVVAAPSRQERKDSSHYTRTDVAETKGQQTRRDEECNLFSILSSLSRHRVCSVCCAHAKKQIAIHPAIPDDSFFRETRDNFATSEQCFPFVCTRSLARVVVLSRNSISLHPFIHVPPPLARLLSLSLSLSPLSVCLQT